MVRGRPDSGKAGGARKRTTPPARAAAGTLTAAGRRRPSIAVTAAVAAGAAPPTPTVVTAAQRRRLVVASAASAAAANDLNLRYVRLWSAPTTRAQIYLTSNDVTGLAVETIFNGLNVTEEAAKLVVLEKFRFPTKSDCEKFTVDSFVGYAKRDIATWHYKAKGMLFASYLEGLVSRKEYGHFVQRGRHRVPVLPRHQARTLLENNKFITSSTSYNALVAAMIDFLSSVPEASCLLVACSPTVSEAFLRLLSAQLLIRMELTTLAGLPKLTSLGTNADEVMRKLWAIESQETAAFHDKKTIKYGRLVIVDGEDPERANVSAYTENVLAPLRRQMLVVLPAAKDTSGTIVPPADAAVEVPIAATSATPHASLPPELFAAASESGGAAVAAVEPAGPTSQVMPQGRMGLSGLDLRALRPTN
ncbi:hypothetical protein I4F81_003549 [Pyropia yezoensis]|uniref:Uncharacterized protein n=1 Tax=Pyropia yezoensis TaxID=2788 RepID=A0ACC3BSS2_PYRYE|nr:hypothetical protein I4F81_003549 [Neopyropia yezoensis]